MRTGCRAEVRWLSCFSPSGAVGSYPGAPFALAGGHRQSGRSVGEKAGEQASWPRLGSAPRGGGQRPGADAGARAPLSPTRGPSAAGPPRPRLPRGAPPARRPSLASLCGRCRRGSNAPRGLLSAASTAPLLRFAAAAPAAPVTLAVRRGGPRVEGERPAGSGIPSGLRAAAASCRRRAPRSCNFQGREERQGGGKGGARGTRSANEGSPLAARGVLGQF